MTQQMQGKGWNDMSKVLVISTSLRAKSNSDILTEKLIEGAKESGHDVEHISLKGKNIGFCIGCLACQSSQKCVIGDDAVEYLTTESEVKDNVTEDDIKELEAPEYGATRDNFVCLVLTNNKEVYYGEEHTYEGDDRVTTTLYGYFVNDKQGYKLTLVKYDNPYEFNLSPEEK